MYTGVFECLPHANDANGCWCAHWIQRHAIQSEIQEASKSNKHVFRLPPRNESCFNAMTICYSAYFPGTIWVDAGSWQSASNLLTTPAIGQLLSIFGLTKHYQ
jgi:hypothetical protein